MENRTIEFKMMLREIELFNNDHFSGNEESFARVDKALGFCRDRITNMAGVKQQLKNQFEKQNMKDATDEKLKENLGVSSSKIKEIIDSTDETDDYDKIIDASIKMIECQYEKAASESEKREHIKMQLDGLKEEEVMLNECFGMLKDFWIDMQPKIQASQIKRGNISNLPEVSNISILLGKNEKCFLKLEGIELYEDRAIRDTTGGYGGFGFRVAKGISFRVGGFKARGESHMEKRCIDKGTLYVTNKRYIFDGSTKNIDGDLREVISVEAYDDGIKISRANKRDEVFVGDLNGEHIGAVISGLVKYLK
mgnify:CR=1 FL=1